ncbi:MULTISPECIES: hypothetical protein [unclassified Nocardioides]|uniref:hypothetical protein n=1 Tax=unclassified Nocardioides TaxID=2615069 RepID=UPI0006FF9D45|nr:MULTISPECIES: hypothetical protein [unclassified Nocardioides]KQY50099.1 hypothetical protein ASD30_21440 [Nocardioides sp. Root140]KQZ75723.1 hypothetical protein ASD66_05165 [Nocardioides sp. Root151]KRF14795.1 hypothetical protein ASH02_10950 [Nocardioides sp. Soil796]
MRADKTVSALAGLCAVLLLSAGSCVDDVAKGASKGGGGLVRSEGDDAIVLGTRRADDILLQVPTAIQPTLGARLRSSVDQLSSNTEVQDALEGLAWETTCALVFDRVPTSLDEVASFLVERAVSFGISFFDEGEQQMAEIVLDAFSEQGNEAQDACNDMYSQ